MALYLIGYWTKPREGRMTPEPMESMVVTATTKPYLPEQVPSTSVKSFCLTVSISLGPKYLGWRRTSCSREIM